MKFWKSAALMAALGMTLAGAYAGPIEDSRARWSDADNEYTLHSSHVLAESGASAFPSLGKGK